MVWRDEVTACAYWLAVLVALGEAADFCDCQFGGLDEQD